MSPALTRPIREIWLSARLMRLIASRNEVAARSVGVPCVFDRDAVRTLTEDSVIDPSRLRQRVGGLGSTTPLDIGVSRMFADADADGPAGTMSQGVR